MDSEADRWTGISMAGHLPNLLILFLYISNFNSSMMLILTLLIVSVFLAHDLFFSTSLAGPTGQFHER